MVFMKQSCHIRVSRQEKDGKMATILLSSDGFEHCLFSQGEQLSNFIVRKEANNHRETN
jgi:hypothetical protein